MVEAKLRVEVTNFSNAVTEFYGTILTKKVIEETQLFDKDERKDIAPYGIVATFSIDKKHNDLDGKCVDEKEVFDIKVNRRYLDYEGNDGYLAFFHIDERVYEVYVKFEDKKISYISLSEWFDNDSFEDGEDADAIYGKGYVGILDGLVNCDIIEE